MQTQAQKLITQHTRKQLININTHLSNLTRSNRNHDCLSLFINLHSSTTLSFDHYSLSTALSASSKLPSQTCGTQLHALAIVKGLQVFPIVSNTLLSLYAKSNDLGSVELVFNEMGSPDNYSWTTLLSAFSKLGCVEYACKVLDEMPERKVEPWNAVITGCAENGMENVGLCLFRRMRVCGVSPDAYSFGCIVCLCSSVKLFSYGEGVHCLVLKSGFLGRSSVVNSLVSMYFGGGNVDCAWNVFTEVDWMVRDEITYNAMINGLVSFDRKNEGLVMFKDMLEGGLRPTELTFVSLMSSGLSLSLCVQVHAQALKAGYESCTAVSNVAMAMYSEHGLLDYVRNIFEELRMKDVVSWNTMIGCYARNKKMELAVSVYKEMLSKGFVPDEYAIGTLFANSENLETVLMFYALVVKNGLVRTSEVVNALVSVFSKLGDIDAACRIFLSMQSKNLISWNAITSGFLSNGHPLQALELILEMQKSEVHPDVCTLTNLLSICSRISAIRLGKEVHCYILRHQFTNEISLGNGLITMYAKCGHLNLSIRAFDCMSNQDVVTWNAILSAFAQYGEGKQAVKYFTLMQHKFGLKPDQATFTAVLSACSRTGLVCDGIRIFNSMINDHRLEPGVDHFSCLVDLLGRSGYIDEMERLIQSEDFKDDPNVWWTLFSACATYGNVRLGRIVSGLLLQTEKNDSSIYVLLSNIHANAGQWEDAARVRELMNTVRVIKQPGFSWIKP